MSSSGSYQTTSQKSSPAVGPGAVDGAAHNRRMVLDAHVEVLVPVPFVGGRAEGSRRETAPAERVRTAQSEIFWAALAREDRRGSEVGIPESQAEYSLASAAGG